jgi:hypothetical protein
VAERTESSLRGRENCSCRVPAPIGSRSLSSSMLSNGNTSLMRDMTKRAALP